MSTQESSTRPGARDDEEADFGGTHQLPKLVARVILVFSAIACLAAFGYTLVNLLGGGDGFRSGLAAAVGLLFLLVSAQASLYIGTLPARERLLRETGELVEALALKTLPDEEGEEPAETASLFRRAATTFARWFLFLKTTAATAGLLGVISAALVGLLTVFVAYQQVVLLDSQNLVMERQTRVMTAENNARTLEYHLESLVDDVRQRRGAHVLEDREAAERIPTWEVLKQRANVISRSLEELPVVREGSEVKRSGEPVLASRERGQLLAVLVSEKFDWNAAAGVTLEVPNADLTALPPAPAFSTVDLGPIDLSGSYATEAGLGNYDLTRADLSGAVLPEAIAFRGSILRRIPSLARIRLVEPDRFPHAVLDGARVPGDGDDDDQQGLPAADWLRELEAVVGIEGFSAVPWRIRRIGSEGVIVPHPVPEMQQAEEALERKLREVVYCSDNPYLECEQAVADFCGLYRRLFLHPALSAQERGSLFALSLALIDPYASGGQRLTREESKRFPELEACVGQESFGPGKLLVDISMLEISNADLRNVDLANLRMRGAQLDGYFSGATLPDALSFAEARRVFDAQGWTDFDAFVPAPDWEYQVCSARAGVGHVLEEPFFPFDTLDVGRSEDGRFTFQWGTGSCDGPLLMNPSPAEREAFCRRCAVIPE